MTVNSSATSVILILFTFSDNLSAESSKSSADFCIQLIHLLECMGGGDFEPFLDLQIMFYTWFGVLWAYMNTSIKAALNMVLNG